MKRTLFEQLKAWRNKPARLPILLRGARQVGKSFLVMQFAQECFDNVININFEQSPEYLACFQSLKSQEIINAIEVIGGHIIAPGKTLLFLDEIQVCPKAIMALRYFKEEMPELHVIGAGSLLEFALREQGFSMPVGRVQYLYLKPLSFREYLIAAQREKLLEYLDTIKIGDQIPAHIHEQAIKWVREFMVVGGMPMVVADYLQNRSWRNSQEAQTVLLKTYYDDFSKYSTDRRHKYLQQVYYKAPGLVGQQIKYSHISQEMESRYLKDAIEDLVRAGVLFQVFSSSAAGLPLFSCLNPKKFKLLFLDIGLLKRATKLDIDLLLNDDIMLMNRGALTEQFVGQELLAYQDPYEEPQLYYWTREAKSSMAEVDYLLNYDHRLIPIEVKSGKTGTLKSLRLLMDEKQLSLGIRISEREFSWSQNILSIPFYMISQLDRLIRDLG